MNHPRRWRFAAVVAGLAAALAVTATPAAAAADDSVLSDRPSGVQAMAGRVYYAVDHCANWMADTGPRSYDVYTTDAAHGGHTWGQVWIDRRGTYGGQTGYTACVHSGLDDRATDGHGAISYARYWWWNGSQWVYEPHDWIDRVDGEGAAVSYFNVLFDFPVRDFYVGVCLSPIDAPTNCDSDID